MEIFHYIALCFTTYIKNKYNFNMVYKTPFKLGNRIQVWYNDVWDLSVVINFKEKTIAIYSGNKNQIINLDSNENIIECFELVINRLKQENF